jgi:hypothetical protein
MQKIEQALSLLRGLIKLDSEMRQDVLFPAEKELSYLKDLLKSIEWIEATCPVCGAMDYKGHSPDCKLAKLIQQP